MDSQALTPCNIDHMLRSRTFSVPERDQRIRALSHLLITSIACGFPVFLPLGGKSLARDIELPRPRFPKPICPARSAADNRRWNPSARLDRSEQFPRLRTIPASRNDRSHPLSFLIKRSADLAISARRFLHPASEPTSSIAAAASATSHSLVKTASCR